MLVYRICNNIEISKLLTNKSLSEIGKTYKIDKLKNTHNYKSNIKYIHFFKEFDSVFYLNTNKNHYICTYNIPDYLLDNNLGLGYYLDRTFLRSIDNVHEYVIDSNIVLFDYLIKIDKIISNIDFDDYLYSSYQNKLETIYIKQNNKLLVLKKDDKNA